MLLYRAGRAAERGVGWLDERRIAPVLRIACGVAVVAIPAAQAFKLIDSPWWLLPMLAAAALSLPLHQYHRGGTIAVLVRQLASANSSFGGAILEIGRRVVLSRTRRLSDEAAEHLCQEILHRIRDLTALVLDVRDRPRLRATLSVPVSSARGGRADALRVWCYDQTHGDRNYTSLPLCTDHGPTPGSPSAYLTGEAQVILDVRAIPATGTRRRHVPYRSIVSIPLAAKGTDGMPLGVVNLDAGDPGFFTPELVAERILPFVAPAVNVIGLVLQLRRPEAPYGFPE